MLWSNLYSDYHINVLKLFVYRVATIFSASKKFSIMKKINYN